MRKIVFLIFLVWFASLAINNWGDKFLPANAIQFAQNLMPNAEMTTADWEKKENSIDPQERQLILREIKNAKRELNDFAKQFPKISNREDEINQTDNLLEQIKKWENLIKTENNSRSAIQEFRDEEIRDAINKLRDKIKIPEEIIQWQQEIKKAEKMLEQKKYQNWDFDLTRAKTKLDETKTILARLQKLYNDGNLENAFTEFNNLHQNFNPEEIINVLQKMREINDKIKIVPDAEIQNQIKQSLSGIIDNFNDGEYRLTQELINESYQEIMATIYKIFWLSGQKGFSQNDISAMTEKLEEKLREKTEQKKAEKNGLPMNFQPIQTIIQENQDASETMHLIPIQ